MDEKEKDYLSDLEGIEAFIPEGGYDLEEILNEDFSSDADVPLDISEPDTGDKTEPAVESRKEPAVPSPLTLDPPAAEPPIAGFNQDGATAGEDPDENDGEDEASGEASEPEEAVEPIQIPNISVKTLALLAIVTLAAVMACCVVLFDLTGAARVLTLIGGLAAACVPMAFMSVDILRERDRIPAPLLMLLAVVVLAVSGGAVPAIVAAIFYDLCQAAISYAFHRELDRSQTRLQERCVDLDKPLAQRLEAILREISYGRVRPIVRQRALERLVVFGVLALAFLISVIVPLFDGMDFAEWAGRGAALLAVCAFADEAAVLMTFLSAAETASGEGIYFSGSASISTATEVTSVLFNKSGTLTDGKYRVVNVDPVRLSAEQLLYLAVCAGAWSEHPLAKAIRDYAGIEPDRSLFTKHTEREGYGSMVSMAGGQIVAAGNIDFMEELGVRGDMYIPGETCVFVAVGRTCVGRIDLADELKPDAVTVVHELRRLKVANVALMTGDNALNATNTGRRLGIAEVYSDCRPKDKVERLQYILDSQEHDDRLMVVSSSGRDREIMEMANVSATLGMGAEVTDAYPDIVITSGKLTDLTRALHISKRVRGVNTLSFFAASGIRLICIVLALAGVLELWSVTALMMAAELVTFLISFAERNK